MQINCPHCQTLAEGNAGELVRCIDCKKVLEIPKSPPDIKKQKVPKVQCVNCGAMQPEPLKQCRECKQLIRQIHSETKIINIEVHAGDFIAGVGKYCLNTDNFVLQTEEMPQGEKILSNDIVSLEKVDDANVSKFGDVAKKAAVGGLLFGAVGVVGGILLGSKSKPATFIAQFKDGRKVLASIDSSLFFRIQKASFK